MPELTNAKERARSRGGLTSEWPTRDDNASRVRDAWGCHLHRFAWTHWLTLTPVVPECSGEPLWREFRLGLVRRLAWEARRSIQWVAAMERGQGGVLHIHALLSGTGDLSLACVAAAWRLGVKSVDRYDPNRRAAWYLSKTLHLPDREWARFDASKRLPQEREARARMIPREASRRLSSGVGTCLVTYSNPQQLSGNPVSGSACGLSWTMSVPELATQPYANGFWWDSPTQFVTCCFHGQLQNGPLIVNFSNAVKSATISTWDGWLGFSPAPAGVKIRAVNAVGDTLRYAVTDGVNPVVLSASGIWQLVVYPVEKGTVNAAGDKDVEMVEYQIEYVPECPPIGDPMLDNDVIRLEFREALARSLPYTPAGTPGKAESGGVIWKMDDGSFRAVPFTDPNPNECRFNGSAAVLATRPADAGPNTYAYATYHSHPQLDFEEAYGCLPSGGVNWSQTPGDNLTLAKVQPDDPKAGGGSPGDWNFANTGGFVYVITKSGRVYKLPPNYPPSQRAKNPNKWSLDARGCAALIP